MRLHGQDRIFPEGPGRDAGRDYLALLFLQPKFFFSLSARSFCRDNHDNGNSSGHSFALDVGKFIFASGVLHLIFIKWEGN